MSFKMVPRVISFAVILSFAAGIFSAEVFAAKNTTPTIFGKTTKSASNNEDGFFESLARDAKKNQRKNERLNRKKNSKVNDTNTEETRTQETAQRDRKGRRNNPNRQQRMERSKRLTAPTNNSAGGNE